MNPGAHTSEHTATVRVKSSVSRGGSAIASIHKSSQVGSSNDWEAVVSTSSHGGSLTQESLVHPSQDLNEASISETSSGEGSSVQSGSLSEETDSQHSEPGEGITPISNDAHPHGQAFLLSQPSRSTSSHNPTHNRVANNNTVGGAASGSRSGDLGSNGAAHHSPNTGRQSPQATRVPSIVWEKLESPRLSRVHSSEDGSGVNRQSQSQHSAKGLGITAGSGVNSQDERPPQPMHWPPQGALLDPREDHTSQRGIGHQPTPESETRPHDHLQISSNNASGKRPASASHVSPKLRDSHVTSSHHLGPQGPASPFLPYFI